MLSLAAENSFGTFKALNPHLSPAQINTLDHKGNTALFYTVKHRNVDFIEDLLARKADPNIRCSKGNNLIILGLTPLHMAFKTN